MQKREKRLRNKKWSKKQNFSKGITEKRKLFNYR